MARLTDNPRSPALVFGPYLVRGVVDLVLAATRNLPTAATALAVYGAGTSTGMVTYNSLLKLKSQRHCAAECSRASTRYGRPEDWPPWHWAPLWQTSWEFRPST